MNQRKTRRGIGWHGRVFAYATAVNSRGTAELKRRDGANEKGVELFNKDPAVKRAAKKAQRRDDIRHHHT